MMLTAIAILQPLMTLAAIALGWFLNEKSRKTREDRAALGRTLATLILFRRRMAGIRLLVQRLSQFAITSASQQTEVQMLLSRLTPQLRGWEKEYDDAVNYLSGLNPMLAIAVRTAAMRATFNLPAEWPTGPNAPQGFSDIASAVTSHLTDPSTLDKPIRQLAKMHGRKTLASVNEELKSQDDPDPEVNDLMSRLVAFAGKPEPPTNTASS